MMNAAVASTQTLVSICATIDSAYEDDDRRKAEEMLATVGITQEQAVAELERRRANWVHSYADLQASLADPALRLSPIWDRSNPKD